MAGPSPRHRTRVVLGVPVSRQLIALGVATVLLALLLGMSVLGWLERSQ